MHDAVATGVPAWPAIERGFDLSPLIIVLAGIVLARFMFGLRLTPLVLGLLILGGTVTSWLAELTGLVPAGAIGFLALLLGSAWMHRSQPR